MENKIGSVKIPKMYGQVWQLQQKMKYDMICQRMPSLKCMTMS